MLNNHQIRSVIRGTDTEKVLLVTHGSDGPAALEALQGVTKDASGAQQAVLQLRQLGLASPQKNLAATVRLTALGTSVAQEILQSRTNGPDRMDAVQRAILRFCAAEDRGRASDILRTADNVVKRIPLTEQEVDWAVEYLTEAGLLRVLGALQAPDLRPEVTAQGRYAMFEPNIREYVDRGFRSSVVYDSSTNTTVSGGILGAVVGGSHNTASVHQSIGDVERARIVATAQQVLDELSDDEDDVQLRNEMVVIQQQALDPGVQKESLLARVGSALALAAASSVGERIVPLLAQLSQLISS